MPLTIKLVSEHRDLVGNDCVREYYEDGGTIGRALQNDWILPDPDRYISGRHATIDYKGGMYYLADTSSNGVYINGEIEPIGKGNPRRLFDGDHMRMGDFEFEITIDKGESLVMPIEPEPSVAPDHIEQFVDEDVIETGMQLLDESEITGDDEFQSVLFGKEPKKVEPKVEPKPKMEMISANDDSADQSVDVTADDLFDSFLDGLGISRAELHSSDNLPEMMMSAGLVLREFVEGTINLLAGRANLKNAFCLDQTTVLPRQNNPMKFSDNTDDLIKQLLVGDEGEYLEARDAVREANRDLINHQNAFLDAMNSAFIEFADRFDPDELQDRFDRTLNNKLLSFLNKSQYWNLYKDLYPIMTERGAGRFPQMFGEEFVKAYERQVAEYQRHDHEGTARPGLHDEPADQVTGPGLLATQKLDAPVIAESVGSDLAFEERDVVEPVSSDELHDSLIDDLENTLAGEIRRDQMGG
ncbi:MAG: type VI secretion system-associated FHA domain protein TagH [Gammaproteobacteria bacterium]|nr:type VI secretion system-associated FHA domain protein TagH [Gammaproteobacteria bacterium]